MNFLNILIVTSKQVYYLCCTNRDKKTKHKYKVFGTNVYFATPRNVVRQDSNLFLFTPPPPH